MNYAKTRFYGEKAGFFFILIMVRVIELIQISPVTEDRVCVCAVLSNV